MDRVIVYPGALPQTTDVLLSNKFGVVGQAYQNLAMLGSSTVVAGLACTPASPTANLTVTVGVGSIYQLDPTDQAAYGDLGTDNNNIMKQGILAAPVVLPIVPPATSGFSQVFLVQAILNDVDSGSLTLSYFDSADETKPYSGPANSGTSNFTTRTCPCVIALKAGVSATTGTQTTPAPDVGYVGLYAVTLVNGQTQITSPNIKQQPSAPFFPTLPSVPLNVMNCSWVYQVDTGSANAYAVTFGANQPQPVSYTAGMTIKFKALVTNTGASTVNVNGLGTVAIRRATGVALSAADITSGQIVELTYDGTVFQMVNYLGAGATTSTITTTFIPYVVDSGTSNALIGTYSPAITVGQQVAGLFISIKIANNITGACTINVNGLGLKSVLLGDLANPRFNVFLAGEVLLLVYDGTQYQVVNTSSATYLKPIANTTIFVNGAIGNDANDGVSNTVGHALATIQGGVNKAFSYAPSIFTITVVVASGIYPESVNTPGFAGPNLIIDGGSAAGTIVSSGSGSGIAANGPNTLTVRNITVQNTGNPNVACGFIANNGAVLVAQNTASNSVASAVFLANNLGLIYPGNHTFSGSCTFLAWGVVNGIVKPNGVWTFSTAISTAGGCAAWQGGQFDLGFIGPSLSFVNPNFVSGPKYEAKFNGTVVAVSIGGVNNLPGSAAGIVDTGGQAQ